MTYYEDERVVVHHGDCLDVLRGMADASVDAVVTDPPYGLEFMGKDWDSFRTYAGGNPNRKPQGSTAKGSSLSFAPDSAPIAAPGYRQKNPRCRRCGKLQRGNGSCKCPEPQWDTRTAESANQFQFWCEQWAAECLRVLKPGGHMLAFGGTRTWHRLACAVEDAGFEVRDSIAWIHSQGFPKSMNVGNGRGTALKPAHEPVMVARKPLGGTVVANLERYGTGALNIDAARVGAKGERFGGGAAGSSGFVDGYAKGSGFVTSTSGRWPTNVLLDGDAAAELDEQSGTRRSAGDYPSDASTEGMFGQRKQGQLYADEGGASRFFPVFRYQAKAPTRERVKVGDVAHPTVKPLALMRWLVRLVTPPGGVVLDPFAGSGTTIEAAILEGFRVIGIEREADYLPLIEARIARVQPTQTPTTAAADALALFDIEEPA